MTTLALTFTASPEELSAVIQDIQRPIAIAATAAIKEAAEIAKTRGRANIAAGGFSKRWQNALRSRTYPAGSNVSINAAALIWHNIPYASVFEEGATIEGHPLLWLPLNGVPLGVGGRPLKPREFAARYGRLVSVNQPGKRPLLFLARDGRSGHGKQFAFKAPLYVGIDAVTIRKRFDLRRILAEVAASLDELYAKHVKKVA